MAKFNIDVNGYNVTEVEDYIDSMTIKYEKRLSEQKDQIFALRNENSMINASLNDYKLKEEEVSKALIFAVEKSEQMERGSKKVHELEIRRLRLMYTRWKEILEVLDKDSFAGIHNGKFAYLLQEFEKDLELINKQNEAFEARFVEEESIRDSLKENSSNYIRNLLNRIDYMVSDEVDKKDNKADKKKQKTNVKKEKIDKENKKEDSQEKKENSRLLNINRRFNNISSKLGLATGEAILDDDIVEDNAYFKNIAKEKEESFDLDAILTPKEDLAEIMKAFEEI